jgi:hypothetical protein
VVAVESTDDLQWPHPLRHLIGMPVRIGDVDVGRISDVLLNRSLGHVLGFAVEGRGAHRHFLPWVAARLDGDHVATLSIFGLLSTSELAFYVDNGARLTEELRGFVEDILVDRDGDVVSLVSAAAPRRPRVRSPRAS